MLPDRRLSAVERRRRLPLRMGKGALGGSCGHAGIGGFKCKCGLASLAAEEQQQLAPVASEEAGPAVASPILPIVVDELQP
jgi:hypothetical protein